MAFLRSPVMRRLRPGLAATLDAKEPYRDAWRAENRRALEADGPLWVVLGDSTAQAIGASAFDRGYVGQLRERLEARDGRRWRLLNASVSGARIRDVLADQLPWFEGLVTPAQLVTCAAGANDLLRPGIERTLRDLSLLIGRLPRGAVLATVPQGLGRTRAQRMNALIERDAPDHGLVVADVWATTSPPWAGRFAADGFHPNDDGYRSWADAFALALGIP